MNSPLSRIIGADVVRVLAMLLVVYLHTIYSFTMRSDFFGTKAWFFFVSFSALSKTSMVLFFMLSGYLVIGKNRSINENLHLTIKRIIIPFVSFLLIIVVFETFKLHLPIVGGLWSRFLATLPRFPNNWLWFLAVLFFFYILNPLWNTIFSKERKPDIALYVAKFFLIYTLVMVTIKFTSNNLDFFNNATIWLGYLFFYLYGGIVRNNWVHINNKTSIILIVLGMVLTIIGDYYALYAKVNAINFPYAKYLTDNLSVPAILLGIGVFNLFIAPQNQPLLGKMFRGRVLALLVLLSGLSYGIYLMHPIVIGILSEMLGISLDTARMNVYLYNVAFFLAVLGISAFATFILLRIPKLRMIIGGE